MEDMFSTQTVRGLLGFIRCELLLLEAINWSRDRSKTQGKGNVRRLKPLPSNGTEDVTVNTTVCVCNSEL
jgi:hypothetical protein